jgi:3',5'-cyclic AMP phosphodiesterase CpdA
MIKIIHISDLHFHKHPIDNQEIEATLAIIKRKYPDHYLLITGDITDDGHEKQYENAAKALQEFEGRVFVCPGNHDFGAAGNFYSAQRAALFDQYLSKGLNQGGTFQGKNEPVVNVIQDKQHPVMLIALDSNLETEHPFDFACGRVGEHQLKMLDTILASPGSCNMTKIVFLHHHPFVRNNPFMELQDARAFMRCIYGRIDALAFGHKHILERWVNQGGVPTMLAAHDTPGKDVTWQLIIENGQVLLEPISIGSD